MRGDKNMVQLGRYNVRMDRGNNVHIGDRIYRGIEADTIRDVLADVASGQIGRGSLRGPPPVLLQGFASAFIGVVVGAVGQLIRGWEKARR